MKLSDLIIEGGGTLGTPMIIGLQGAPGLGKSHLIEAFIQKLQQANISSMYIAKPPFLIAQKDFEWRKARISITDDLFQQASSIDDAFSIWENGGYDIKYIPEFLFDLYDNKKIWVLTSNLNIKDILNRIAEKDTVGRLKDRIGELLATIGTIHLEGESHRKILASTGNKFAHLFK